MTANPVPYDSDFMPDWARVKRVETARLRTRIRGMCHEAFEARTLGFVSGPKARRQRVLTLFKAGLSQRALAKSLGLSAGRIQQMCKVAQRERDRAAGGTR